MKKQYEIDLKCVTILSNERVETKLKKTTNKEFKFMLT